MVSYEEVVAANIAVHTRMADSYGEEPHWRPENQEKVARRLQGVLPSLRDSALDVGCGSGFLTRMLQPHFEHVSGVDITTAMMQRVPKYENVTLYEARAEALPFGDSSFSMVTAYSFLHHLIDHQPVLSEMYRVLKPGGHIYIDLEPNRAYWNNLELVEQNALGRAVQALQPIVSREISATLHVEAAVEAEFGIEQDVFRAAEFSKSITGGFDVIELEETLGTIGFRKIQIHLDWFMGQGVVMHGDSFESASIIENHLQLLRPASDGLFKYLWFTATKE